MVNKDEYSNAAVQTADRELEFGSIQFCVQCEPAFHSRVRVRLEGGGGCRTCSHIGSEQ